MKVIRRFVCLSLVAVLLLSYPLTAFAASPSVALDPKKYVIGLLLDACGLEISTEALSSWVGNITGYEEYVELGKKGQLGAYSQWIYDVKIAHQTEIDKAREEFQDSFGWMIDLDSAKWGDDITLADGALESAYAGIKDWLSTFPAYGTGEKRYSLGYNTSIDRPPFDYLPDVVYLGEVKRGLTYLQYGYLRYPLEDVVGYIDGDHCTLYNVHTLERINYTNVHYTFDDGVWSFYSLGNFAKVPYNIIYDKIPIFKDRATAFDYMEAVNMPGSAIKTIPVNYPANFGINADGVNMELQKTVVSGLGNTISLPADETIAKQQLEGIDMSNAVDEILKAIVDAGLVLSPGVDIPDESETTGDGTDTETKATLASILAKIEAIPATIEAMLDKKLDSGNTDDDVENMKLPTSIADKFPFCIPFDLIYLVKAMNASSEVPRFELPFKIHYQDINYEHTFVVDMSDWDAAVKILRTMLDLLFVAGLISTTRELIRG